MHIVSSPLKDYGNFELDVNAIVLKSVSEKSIILPYFGVLPSKIVEAKNAVICFNLQPMQATKVVLVAESSAKQFRRPLEAPVSQICNLMDRFFLQKYTGLSDFYRGIWQAYYDSWRQSRTEPLRFLAPLSELPQESLELLVNRLC